MVKIIQLSQLDLSASYSYADYLTWQLGEAIELIKGKISLMSPTPNVKHQSLSTCRLGQLFIYFRRKPCKIFAAPFDVRLYDRRKSILASKDIFTVVQPDICVICDPDKLDDKAATARRTGSSKSSQKSVPKRMPRSNMRCMPKAVSANTGWFFLMKPSSSNSYSTNKLSTNWHGFSPATTWQYQIYSRT